MTQADIADYATWTEPETSFQVQYSLPLFHEIDMTVSEGYRRIPHGGIEVGGLLFGRHFPEGARIEAFRLIECEHAQGPSFKLSERDIAGFREQINKASGDPELGGLETLGWFIAHTRGPLQLTEAEVRLFDEFLPGAGQMTVLVKPEKFKPTLFTFLIRNRDARLRTDGAEQAFILPLPGRPSRQAEVPAMPTPLPSLASPPSRVQIERAPPRRETVREPAPAVLTPVVQPAPPPPDIAPPPPPPAVVPPPPPLAPPVQAQAPTHSSAQVPVVPIPVATVPPPAPTPAPFEWQFDRSRVEPTPLFGEYERTGAQAIARDAEPAKSRKGGAVAAIVVAAILGVASGYWFYQQMPAPFIQLTVEPQPTGLIVSWSPDQTSNAEHAFVRVNNGPLLELPAEAKSTGRWQVDAVPDNLKVEIIAQHYMHDSRGTIRYLQPAAPSAVSAPAR